MMLAFYGWTDTLLLNSLNTKISCFADEPADLFVLDLSRVSRELVCEIEKSGAFENVFWITRPAFHKDIGPLTFREKVIKLFSGERYYRCYKKQLSEYCCGKSYSALFTGAFWSETLFLFRFFRKSNPDIKVNIVEEGTTNYSSPAGWQFKCMPTSKLRERMMRCIYFPFTWRRARSRVAGIYLYSTEITRNDTDIKAVKLPVIDKKNAICYSALLSMAKDVDISEYERRSVYFISNPIINGYENSFDETYKVIDAILSIIPKGHLIIKAHPAQQALNEQFAKQYEPEVFVDRRGFAFEAAIADLDLSSKVIIARNSSVPLSIRTRLNKEPCAIYTYKLYDFCQRNGEPNMDITANDMLVLYSSEKFCAPDSFGELEKQLENWVSEVKFISV